MSTFMFLLTEVFQFLPTCVNEPVFCVASWNKSLINSFPLQRGTQQCGGNLNFTILNDSCTAINLAFKCFPLGKKKSVFFSEWLFNAVLV